MRAGRSSKGVAEKLAAGVNVHLASPVRHIVHGETGVVIHFDAASGKDTISASHVVVAVPPKLVTEIGFEPALPAKRAQRAQKMPMGAVIKHTAFYAEPPSTW